MERFWHMEDTQGLAVAAVWSIWAQGGRLQILGEVLPQLLQTDQTHPGWEKLIKEKTEDRSTKRKDRLDL